MRELGAELSIAMMAAKPKHPLIWCALGASLDDKFDAAGAHRMSLILGNCTLPADKGKQPPKAAQAGLSASLEMRGASAEETVVAEPSCAAGEGGAEGGRTGFPLAVTRFSTGNSFYRTMPR